MKALTVRQPWAWCIVHGGKDVENRTRNVAGQYRGPVAIHAGLKLDDAGLFDFAAQEAWREHGYADQDALSDVVWPAGGGLSLGAIIGVVDLIDVHEHRGDWYDERCDRWGQRACTHLLLDNPRPVDPIPCRGRLGLWTPPAEVLARVS